jgi:hypothetical protein
MDVSFAGEWRTQQMTKKNPGLPPREMSVQRTNIPPSAQRAAMTVSMPEHLPENHPFYAAVGRIASEWSHIEHLLDQTIWDLAGINAQVGACITSQIMGVGPRCKAIITLGIGCGMSKSLQKKFRTLMSDSYSTAVYRARAVHDPWYASLSGKPAQFKAMPYDDPRFGIKDVEQSDLDEDLKKILALQNRANELRVKLAAELAASREKPE